MPNKKLNIKDKRFGKLIAKSIFGKNKHGAIIWKCICDCKKITNVIASQLKNGSVKSCGCKRTGKHGQTGSRLYKRWQIMLRRCYCIDNSSYPHYGGRNIKVCDRWKKSFVNFAEDMISKFDPSLQLDRIDNNGDYCANNCKWSTREEQARNKRNSYHISYMGEILNINQLAEKLQMNPTTISSRIKMGWSMDKIITTPVKTKIK